MKAAIVDRIQAVAFRRAFATNFTAGPTHWSPGPVAAATVFRQSALNFTVPADVHRKMQKASDSGTMTASCVMLEKGGSNDQKQIKAQADSLHAASLVETTAPAVAMRRATERIMAATEACASQMHALAQEDAAQAAAAAARVRLAVSSALHRSALPPQETWTYNQFGDSSANYFCSRSSRDGRLNWGRNGVLDVETDYGEVRVDRRPSLEVRVDGRPSLYGHVNDGEVSASIDSDGNSCDEVLVQERGDGVQRTRTGLCQAGQYQPRQQSPSAIPLEQLHLRGIVGACCGRPNGC